MRKPPEDYTALKCSQCRDQNLLGFEFLMAFQPIIDLQNSNIFAYEALVRGENGEGAGEVLARVNDQNRYRFDQVCRVKAIETATRLGITSMLSINFLPRAVYKPELCLKTTVEAAETYGFSLDKIIFEITEREQVDDYGHIAEITRYYQNRGLKVALDDFGAGYSGLGQLIEVPVNILKIDMYLLRGIDRDSRRQEIVRAIANMADKMNIQVIAEGIETKEELRFFTGTGIHLFQGYYIGRPETEALPEVNFSKLL